MNRGRAKGRHGGEIYKDTDLAKYYGYVGAAPSIDVEKYVSDDGGENWHDADEAPGLEVTAGDDVWFSFVVTNDGDATLRNISLEDSDFDLGGCDVPDELAPDESFTCEIGPFEAEEGQHTDTATATGDHGEETYSDEDEANYLGYVPAAPSIDVEKYVSTDGTTWQDADDPTGPEVPVGDPVWFRFVVTNDGNVTLTDITLSDSDFDVSGCTLTDPLAPDDSFECVIGSYEAEEGQHTDTATATGDYDGQTYSDEDDANYYGSEEEWDHSSLYFDEDYGCQGDCDEISVTVCNGDDSEDMEGTTTWELYWIASGNPKDGTVIASGIINALAAGDCQILTYNPAHNPNGASGNYMFKAYQRPGHPGTGELWSDACELDCELAPAIDL
jgi:YqxM protein